MANKNAVKARLEALKSSTADVGAIADKAEVSGIRALLKSNEIEATHLSDALILKTWRETPQGADGNDDDRIVAIGSLEGDVLEGNPINEVSEQQGTELKVSAYQAADMMKTVAGYTEHMIAMEDAGITTKVAPVQICLDWFQGFGRNEDGTIDIAKALDYIENKMPVPGTGRKNSPAETNQPPDNYSIRGMDGKMRPTSYFAENYDATEHGKAMLAQIAGVSGESASKNQQLDRAALKSRRATSINKHRSAAKVGKMMHAVLSVPDTIVTVTLAEERDEKGNPNGIAKRSPDGAIILRNKGADDFHTMTWSSFVRLRPAMAKGVTVEALLETAPKKGTREQALTDASMRAKVIPKDMKSTGDFVNMLANAFGMDDWLAVLTSHFRKAEGEDDLADLHTLKRGLVIYFAAHPDLEAKGKELNNAVDESLEGKTADDKAA